MPPKKKIILEEDEELDEVLDKETKRLGTIIQEEDFRLIPLKRGYKFDLEFMATINKGKENERQEYKHEAYGVSLESAIKRIARHRQCLHWDNNKIVTMQQFLEDYKKCLDETKRILSPLSKD